MSYQRKRFLDIEQIKDKYVVYDPATEKYFKLGLAEGFILNLLDGRPLEEITSAFEKKFDEQIEVADLEDFCKELLHLELVETKVQANLIDAQQKQKVYVMKVGWLCNIALRAKIIFNKWILMLLTVMAGYQYFLFLKKNGVAFLADVIRGNVIINITSTFFNTVMLFLITGVIHELGHIICANKYGVLADKIELHIDFINPFFCCDLRKVVFIDSKLKKVAVYLSGIYVDFLCSALFIFGLGLTKNVYLNNFMSLGIIFSLYTLFRNLLPVSKTDGYFVLVELSDIENLNRKSYEFFKAWLKCPTKSTVRTKSSFILFSVGLLNMMMPYLRIFLGPFIILNIVANKIGVIISILLILYNVINYIKYELKWF